jgi:hypothetical protein
MSSQISEDRTTVTLIFDSYIASIGPGISVTDSRKNCQLNVDIRYPGGFQYSILSADYRGYASLQQGISGTLKSTYYFAGQTAQVSFLSPDSSMGIYADDSIVQHAIRLRRPLDRRLPQARHCRQHFSRLVAMRRKRSAQHQLPGPPRQHQLDQHRTPHHRLYRSQVHPSRVRPVAEVLGIDAFREGESLVNIV